MAREFPVREVSAGDQVPDCQAGEVAVTGRPQRSIPPARFPIQCRWGSTTGLLYDISDDEADGPVTGSEWLASRLGATGKRSGHTNHESSDVPCIFELKKGDGEGKDTRRG